MENKAEIFSKAKKLHQSGKIIDAQKLYLKLIEDNFNDEKIHFLIGTSFLQLENYQQARNYLDISIKINPNVPHIYNSRGIVFSKTKKFENAIKDFDKAILLKKDFFEAYLNKAIVLKNIKKFDEGIRCFNECIKLEPQNPKIYFNLGNLLTEFEKYQEAKNAYDKAIVLNNKYAEAYDSRGDVLRELSNINQNDKNFELSIKDYQEALKLNENLDYVYGKIVHTKMLLNDWSDFDKQLQVITSGLKNNKTIIIPFPLLSLIDDPQKHKNNSILFANTYTPTISENFEKKTTANDKIKIGYFSADLNAHAVSHLICKMLRLHDKEKFKIYCYAFGFKEKDELHQRIEKSVDVYRDIRNINDHEAALLARKDEIDIAIDLQGYTSKHRSAIFANKAAPIQINYLGYPGTMGANFIDYIIADKNLIPENSQKFYSEKIIYMPHNYQVQNDELKTAKITPTKTELGLPDDHFIFCAINNNYKILPEVFDTWIKLLEKVEQSILWLLETNEVAKNNLLKEARARKINSDRIVFMKKTSHDIYLSQFQHADLFLDTFVYNAGATASNALWMGLPVLTKIGQSYTSRMASSLLNSIDLPELITDSTEAYIKLAIELATDANKLNSIKLKLKENRLKKPLFNTEKFTRDFEIGLQKVYKNYLENNEPKNISV
ncbi:tetratricopeptide repeat protein [Candidatus Pelagibacter bacterium nBUS_36]|uniref:O-linked N-acetylglucosamine transferase, SPINDLY family protein n=1 Tax=Candidatus Pelagibacter bacterium nBUS_36 TaxID=3374194 RepID=UPI003EBCD9F7